MDFECAGGELAANEIWLAQIPRMIAPISALLF
jgi:hypothetical protein